MSAVFASGPRPVTRGWLRAFVAAWVLLGMVGFVLVATGVRVPEAAGVPALATTTLLVWLAARRWTAPADGRGWRAAVLPQRSRNGEPESDPLTATRRLFLTFCGATVGLATVVFALAVEGGAEPVMSPLLAAGVVLTLGVLAMVAERVVPPPLSCESPGALVATYRTRFLLRIAFAQTAALVGFVGFFLAQHPAVYLVGTACAVVAFAHLAPTRAGLARDQQQLMAAGCPHQLEELLRGTGPEG